MSGPQPSKFQAVSEPVTDSANQSITDAIDDALSQLHAVTGQQPAPTQKMFNHGEGSSNFVDDSVQAPIEAAYQSATLCLIDAMCRAEDQARAVEALARAICPPGTRGNVRIGIGKQQLKRLYDNRLGWLGNEVSLYDHYGEQWLHRHALADDSGRDTLSDSASSMVVDLAGGPRGKQCRIWVEEDPAAIRWLEASKATIAAVLWSRPRRATPSVLRKLGKRSKVWFATGAMLVVGGMMIPVPYRVSCVAKVETVRQRYVAAPFEATLLEVNVRPGDHVQRGQTLVVLDGRPLRLEYESLASELQRTAKEQNVALATREISEAQKFALKQQKITRQMDLIEDRLNNLRVNSPLDGVVVSGDLKRFIGAPVERGQTLVEVAPMDKMTLEFEIPEDEIGFTSNDMPVRVRLDALGSRSIDTTMEEIHPAAEIRDNQNVFIGRIEFDNNDRTLRPGMQGHAIAYGPMRPWVWSWVRSGVERVLWWCGF